MSYSPTLKSRIYRKCAAVERDMRIINEGGVLRSAPGKPSMFA
jgi:hypothetical protein